MNIKALVLAVAGLIVAAFYTLESYLFFQANGFAGPLVVKLAIAAIGAFVFVRGVVRIKAGSAPNQPSAND